MYEALYSPSEGQCAYRCKVLVTVDGAKRYCGKVTKSFKGIKAHCWLVHKLRQQVVMEQLVSEAREIDKQVEERRDGEKTESEQRELSSVRDSTTSSSGGGKTFLSLFERDATAIELSDSDKEQLDALIPRLYGEDKH